jgi:hypothetical protein
MKETTTNWVAAALTWAGQNAAQQGLFRPMGKSDARTFVISKHGMVLKVTRKWNDYNNDRQYALNVSVEMVPLCEREDLRRAFVNMISAEFASHDGSLMQYEISPDGGLNLKFEAHGCTFKSRWTEEAGLVKFKVKAKRKQ